MDVLPSEENVPEIITAGFVKYYGLYWDRDYVDWHNKLMMAVPLGKTGQGPVKSTADEDWNCLNFWGQRGVYILYDTGMLPVYAGQVGTKRSNTNEGNDLGERLRAHQFGKYRNAWHFFSWFGFLEAEDRDFKIRGMDKKQRQDFQWEWAKVGKVDLNTLLSSFEAILIEGFIPRLNARGGDLKGAVRCDQFEPRLNG
jgi:hypothetical protein